MSIGLQILKKNFFEQISSSLSLIVNQYENIMVTGDLNINLLNTISDTRSYYFTFALTNLFKDKTCFKKKSSTLLDVVLTNRPNCFQKTVISEAIPI